MLWGNVKDGWREATREATRASLPLLGSPDALGAYAGERGTEQYPGESEPAYRVRLAQTFDRYAFLGTPTGVVNAVAWTTGVTSVLYREAWQWDVASPLWARFWLVLTTSWGMPLLCGAPEAVCGAPDVLCGMSGVARGTVDFLRRQRGWWRAAHAKCEAMLGLIGGAVICGAPDTVCGDPEVICGAGSVAYL